VKERAANEYARGAEHPIARREGSLLAPCLLGLQERQEQRQQNYVSDTQIAYQTMGLEPQASEEEIKNAIKVKIRIKDYWI